MVTTTQLTRWTEDAIAAPERIDRDGGVIHGVKIIGHQSRNRRTYARDAISKAKSLYENAKVYIDHPSPNKDKEKKGRSIRDKWGVLKNIRETEDGLFGDLHYLKSHDLTERILEAAERFPDSFGLSHNASGEEKKINGQNTVTAIESVYSVDLVGDPATNKGLFESTNMSKTVKQICEAHIGKVEFAKVLQEMYAPEKLQEMDGYDPSVVEVPVDESMDASSEVKEAFDQIMMSILRDESLDINTKFSRLRTIMKAQSTVAEATGKTEKPESEEEDDSEETAEMEESLKRATDEAKRLKEELEAERTRSACERLLRESNREVNDIRIAALVAVDQSSRKSLVESWSPVGQQTEKKRPARSPSKLTESVELESFPKTKEEVKRFLETY